MKDEANIVEQYADSDVGKRIDILIRYYPNFIRLVEGFEQSLSFIIKQEKEMKRRGAIDELGARVQNREIEDGGSSLLFRAQSPRIFTFDDSGDKISKD